MRPKIKNAAAVFLLFGLVGGRSAPVSAALTERVALPAGSKETVLKETMRRVWSEQAIWTRSYIVAAIGGASDAHDTADRLLRNPADIAAVFEPYYGREASAKLAGLLRQHFLIAADVVDGTKTGDQKQFREADQRWRDNAHEIAAFLSGLNPNWSKGELAAMLDDRLALTEKEAESRLHGNWPDDIAAFDAIFGQMTAQADALSDGIIKQYPEKF